MEVKFKSKVDVIDKHSPQVEKWVEKKSTDWRKPPDKVKIIESKFYCRVGDSLRIITKDAGAWCIMVAVENEKGERFSILWNDLEIDYEF